jgi:hypothetical protein
LPDDRERIGARCPNCRDPLYEPPTRFSRLARPDEASCAVHAGMESVGTCDRCGKQVCETCRTRWRGRIWCAPCVDQALGGGEHASEQARTHSRQAYLALGLGSAVWIVSLLALLLLQVLARRTGPASPGAVFLVGLVLVSNILVAAIGVGQALAALRSGGQRGGVALVGLGLSGLYVGVLLGLGVIGLWQS